MGREQRQKNELWRNLGCIFTYLYGKCLHLVINETLLACSPDLIFFFFIFAQNIVESEMTLPESVGQVLLRVWIILKITDMLELQL